jgi:enolase
MKIKCINAREILDSRGNPTLATTVELEDGVIAEASVPSGASTGTNEAVELRDTKNNRFMGMGVLSAVGSVNNVIGRALLGEDAADQKKIDETMCSLDGSKNKGNLGANAILSVSLAVARAQAISEGVELFEYLSRLYTGKKQSKFKLPTPMFNVLNGGKHAQNNIDIQETMIVPIGLNSFEQKLRAGSEIYHTLKNILASEGFTTGLGDEGGFTPDFEHNEMVFSYIARAIKEAGYTTEKVRISIDFATSELAAKSGGYFLKNEDKNYSSEGLIAKISDWGKKYSLYSVEDGLSENDSNWKELTEKIAPSIAIGDDLFTTDPEKIERGAKEGLAEGVIIKPNQIGTLSETMEAVRKAQAGKMIVIISHRSGETEDSFIADLAVAVSADYIKGGAPARSERLAKYNRLCKIEDVVKENY